MNKFVSLSNELEVPSEPLALILLIITSMFFCISYFQAFLSIPISTVCYTISSPTIILSDEGRTALTLIIWHKLNTLLAFEYTILSALGWRLSYIYNALCSWHVHLQIKIHQKWTIQHYIPWYNTWYTVNNIIIHTWPYWVLIFLFQFLLGGGGGAGKIGLSWFMLLEHAANICKNDYTTQDNIQNYSGSTFHS